MKIYAITVEILLKYVCAYVHIVEKLILVNVVYMMPLLVVGKFYF